MSNHTYPHTRCIEERVQKQVCTFFSVSDKSYTCSLPKLFGVHTFVFLRTFSTFASKYHGLQEYKLHMRAYYTPIKIEYAEWKNCAAGNYLSRC